MEAEHGGRMKYKTQLITKRDNNIFCVETRNDKKVKCKNLHKLILFLRGD